MPKRNTIFVKYLYAVNVDEIFSCIRIHIFANMRIIRMNRIFPHLHGHPYQEYYSCSSLFISSSGVFLVAFDSLILNSGDIDNHYISSVGTYIELIWQTTAKASIRPKIALVATKIELSKPTEESFTKFLQLTKDHVASIHWENSVLLLDEILKTSSAEVTEEALRTFHRKVSTLCFHSALRLRPQESRPLSWQKFLDILQQTPSMSIESAGVEWLKTKNELGQTTNVSNEDLEGLQKLKYAVEQMVQVEQERLKSVQHAQGKGVGWQKGESDEKKEGEDEQNEREPTKPRSANQTLSKETTKDKKQATAIQTKKRKHQAGIQMDEVSQEMSTILDYFVNEGEILWYKDKEALRETLITRPMDLVKSLRTIITHKAANKFPTSFQARRSDIRERGLLTFSDFREVYNSETFLAKETWEFIVQLGLGIPLQETKEDKLIMIPCLINETMEPMVNKIERDLDKDEEAMCVRYLFDRNCSTIGLYHKFLEIFSRMFLWGKNGGDIGLAFSQKVEGKKLGCVGGVQGTIKWLTKGMRDPEPFTFLILEYETGFMSDDSDDTIKPFSVERGLRIYLKPKSGKATGVIFDIFKKLDKEFSPVLSMVQRSLSCKECQQGQNGGFFYLNPGIELTSTSRRCEPQLQHEPKEQVINLLKESKGKDLINLETLMAQDKSLLGLEPFESSRIKRDMEEGLLDPGHQIWIYHDSDTDPWNPVARLNKYAHVMIYIGVTEAMVSSAGRTEIHEVVHVSASKGFGKAKIRRQEVLRMTKFNMNSKRSIVKYGVIKPNQMVFLGHEIEGCQFAGNVKDKIVERAKACAEKPSIVFDYDHR